jgi:hypothetical protein
LNFTYQIKGEKFSWREKIEEEISEPELSTSILPLCLLSLLDGRQ